MSTNNLETAVRNLLNHTLVNDYFMCRDPSPRPPTGDDYNDLYDAIMRCAEEAGIDVTSLKQEVERDLADKPTPNTGVRD